METDSEYSNQACERPGGLTITRRATEFCGFPPGARIIDVGCGSGLTVEFLREKCGLEATGIDINATGENSHLRAAQARQLPFEPDSADGVFMECSLSLFNDQEAALSECFRVLKPGGWLIVSDMYARGEAARLTGPLGRIERRETIENLVSSHGFTVKLWEDFSQYLMAWWGQMIMDQKMESFFNSSGCSPESLKRVKAGYFLMIASKPVYR